jgi:hypothetical protein
LRANVQPEGPAEAEESEAQIINFIASPSP